MLHETLVTLIQRIDADEWDIKDVREFVDAMLNGEKELEKAKEWVGRFNCKQHPDN